MKRGLSILLLMLCCGCEPTPQELREQAEREKRENQRTVAAIEKEMFYFQDKRTGLCYAYYWGGAGNGGPAMTLVPREKVQEFLVNP